MAFAQVLAQLRREKGLSQEGLADLMDVSRQAVSKWEAGQSMPDLPRLIALADLFDVSLDTLLRPGRADGVSAALKLQAGALSDGQVQPPPEALPAGAGGRITKASSGYAAVMLGYEYKSARTLFGLPLVHINIGYGLRCARGVFAIGNAAVGAMAVGGVGFGLVGIGGVTAGLLSFGGIAFGGLALGGVAVGAVAVGAVAVGLYALGAAAVASKAAVGVSALAPISAGLNADAHYAITESGAMRGVAKYLRASGVPHILIRLLAPGGL